VISAVSVSQNTSKLRPKLRCSTISQNTHNAFKITEIQSKFEIIWKTKAVHPNDHPQTRVPFFNRLVSRIPNRKENSWVDNFLNEPGASSSTE